VTLKKKRNADAELGDLLRPLWTRRQAMATARIGFVAVVIVLLVWVLVYPIHQGA
jgi:hypothetical protein